MTHYSHQTQQMVAFTRYDFSNGHPPSKCSEIQQKPHILLQNTNAFVGGQVLTHFSHGALKTAASNVEKRNVQFLKTA